MDGIKRDKNPAYVLKSFFRALAREQRQHFRGVKKRSPWSQGIGYWTEEWKTSKVAVWIAKSGGRCVSRLLTRAVKNRRNATVC